MVSRISNKKYSEPLIAFSPCERISNFIQSPFIIPYFQTRRFQKGILVGSELNQSSTIRGEQDLQPHLDVRTLSAPPKDGRRKEGEKRIEERTKVAGNLCSHYNLRALEA